MKQRPTKKFRTRPFKKGNSTSQGIRANKRSFSSGLKGVINGPLHLITGIHKWYVALKYQLFRLSGGILGKGRFPWVKLSLLLIAVFFLFKKDIKFTINLGELKQSAAADTGGRNAKATTVEEMVVGSGFKVSTLKKKTATASLSDLNDQAVEAYISRFLKVAQMEYRKYQIPVSIKLAQGLAESHAGLNEAALKENNHFGQAMQVMTYHTAWENWRAHSVLLHRSYPELFELPSNDYRAWATGLKKAGYSPEKNYDKIIIGIIEAFELDQFDA